MVPKWIPVQSLLPRGFILMPVPKFFADTEELMILKHNSLNGRYKDVPEIIPLSFELLELFGRYLAEGFYSLIPGKGRFISLAAHAKERDILEYFSQYIKSEFGVNSSIFESSSSDNGIELRAYSIDLALMFASLFGTGATNKRVPEQIMNLSAEKLQPFLVHYIGGDGYKRNKQTEYTTASSQ